MYNLLSATILTVLFCSTVASANDSKIIQFYLNQLGFNSGVVDGKPGGKTKSALAKFYSLNTDMEPKKVGINARNDLIKIAKKSNLPGVHYGLCSDPIQKQKTSSKTCDASF